MPLLREQPQACSSSKEGFKSSALNYNTAYSHMKTCSPRGGRSAMDAFKDFYSRTSNTARSRCYWTSRAAPPCGTMRARQGLVDSAS